MDIDREHIVYIFNSYAGYGKLSFTNSKKIIHLSYAGFLVLNVHFLNENFIQMFITNPKIMLEYFKKYVIFFTKKFTPINIGSKNIEIIAILPNGSIIR